MLFESETEWPVELGPEILPTPDPVPLESVPANPPRPGNSDQSDMRTPRSPEDGPRLSSKADAKAGWTRGLSPGGDGYDLAKHLDILAGGPLSGQAEPAADVSPVKPAGYAESKPSAAAGSANAGNWRSSANSGKANENRKGSPPAKDNTSSSGWKRAKRRGAGQVLRSQ